MRRPRALRPGDRVSIVAPASPFAREELEAGVRELQALGFEPVFDDAIFDRTGYLAGPAGRRAATFARAWADPDIAAIIAARGGFGSVQLLPLLERLLVDRRPKAFVGYSDNTSLLTWLTQARGTVGFHGPMVEGRLAKGEDGYDRDSFLRSLCRTEPLGELTAPSLESLHAGEAGGMLTGGTLTLLAASLGTPYGFDPPAGSILFIEDVDERPYRIERLLTQLAYGGVLANAAGIVFGEMRGCDEPGGGVCTRAVVSEFFASFDGPVLFGFPSGHTTGPPVTLPFGVRARVIGGHQPRLVIEEAAVE